MSDHTPVELIVAAFTEENAADEALKQLKQAKREGLIAIDNAAVIRRDEKNKLHIKEVHDMGGGKGAALGGALGLAVGLLAGPVGLAVGAGALIGGIAAKYRDSGFSDKRLKEIGDALKPGTSAIVAVIEHVWVDEVEAMMAEAGADVMTQALKAEIAAQLDAGRDVEMSMLATDNALSMEHTVVGDDMVEHDSMLITDDAVVSEAAIATAEGIAAERTIATEDGTYSEMVAATEDAAVVAASLTTAEGTEAIAAVMMEDDEEAEDADGEESAEDEDDSADSASPETA